MSHAIQLASWGVMVRKTFKLMTAPPYKMATVDTGLGYEIPGKIIMQHKLGTVHPD